MSTMTSADTNRVGLMFMLGAITVFSIQDGLTRYLAQYYPPIVIVMIRYWAFAVFVLALSAGRAGGLKRVARTTHPIVQMSRGLMLAFQIVLVTYCFNQFGLGATHALLAMAPLMIAAAGALFLGERLRLVQWMAIAAGFCGVLVLLSPKLDTGSFTGFALLPLVGAAGFATYSILTKWVSAGDPPETSFFYTGIGGAIGMTLTGPFFWQPMAAEHWGWMALLCVCGATGHFLLIKAYQNAQAASLQPLAYLQLAATSAIGVVIFGEAMTWTFLAGAAIIVAAGLVAVRAGR